MIRAAAAVLLLAAAATAQDATPPTDVCSPSMIRSIVTCHHGTGTTLPFDTWTNKDDELSYLLDTSCCADLEAFRFTCNVAATLTAVADAGFTQDELSIVIAYLRTCRHAPQTDCWQAAFDAHKCVADEMDNSRSQLMDGTRPAASGDCCDEVTHMHDRCVSYDIQFDGFTYHDENSNPDRIVQLPHDLALRLGKDSSDSDNGLHNIMDMYFDHDVSICPRFEGGCTAVTAAAAKCVRDWPRGAGADWKSSPCCWFGEITSSLCHNQLPDAWFDENGLDMVRDETRAVIMECKERDMEQYCAERAIPELYSVDGQMLKPCNADNMDAKVTMWNGKPLCPTVAPPNTRAMTECGTAKPMYQH